MLRHSSGPPPSPPSSFLPPPDPCPPMLAAAGGEEGGIIFSCSTQPHVMTSQSSSSSQKPISEDVSLFFSSVKEKLQNKGPYDEFLKVMIDFRMSRIDLSVAVTRLEELFGGHPDLVLGLTKLMQKKCEIALPLEEERDPAELQNAVAYVEKVENYFRYDEQKYELFLRTLHRFGREKFVNGLYEEVAVLFQGNYDMLKGFRSFLPHNASGVKFYDSPGDEPSNSSSLEKERKRKHIKKCGEVMNGGDQNMGNLWHENNVMDNVQQNQNPSQRVDDSMNEQLDKEPLVNGKLIIRPFRADERDRDKKNVRHQREKEEVYESGIFKVTEGQKKDGTLVSKRMRSHKDSSLKNQKQYTKSVLELDLSNCERCTPSYCLLPEEYTAPPASYRTELDASVLNDVCVSVTSGCEDHSFQHTHKNLYEERLFKCEDDRFELDVLLERINATTKRVEELQMKLENNTIPQTVVHIQDHFTSLDVRCIEMVYGDHGLDVMNMLRSNTKAMLPIILSRLNQKHEEWLRCLSYSNKIWSEIYVEIYCNRTDRQSFYCNQQDLEASNKRCCSAETWTSIKSCSK